MKRRQFLRSSVTLATAVVTLGRPWQSVAQASDQSPVRKSINGLDGSAPEVQKYAKAVAALIALPDSDPRNWKSQARIHNDHCPHSNWWFLPWHRAYLHYFEEVCRDVLKDSSFTLPYWDWTQYPRIPGPFLDRTSSLWNATRNSDGNIELGTETVGAQIIRRIVGSTSLIEVFSAPTTSDQQRQRAGDGLFEGTPHNGVHSTIEGDMGTFMSPLDPIFWLHHCNVDRIWASWQKIANHNVPSSQLWGKHQLTQFYDPATKQQTNANCGDTVNAAVYGSIYDHYESAGIAAHLAVASLRQTMVGLTGDVPANSQLRRFETFAAGGKSVGLGSAAEFRFNISAELGDVIGRAVTPASPDAQLTAETYLFIEDVPQPSSASTALRVFLNCKDPSLNTPLDDPTYVSTVAFFGAGHDGHEATTFALNVTDTLSKVINAGIYKPASPVDVALVPLDLASRRRVSAGEIVRPGKFRLVGVESV